MTIWIDNRGDSPLSEQIVLQLREQILSGSLPPGTALPSIRALAKDLRISVITTKRAYDELEKDGYIHTVAGKGCFVAEKNTELIREENLRQIEQHLRAVADLAAACNLSRGDVRELLELLWDKD
jgi:GntR family transcriptional regulator